MEWLTHLPLEGLGCGLLCLPYTALCDSTYDLSIHSAATPSSNPFVHACLIVSLSGISPALKKEGNTLSVNLELMVGKSCIAPHSRLQTLDPNPNPIPQLVGQACFSELTYQSVVRPPSGKPGAPAGLHSSPPLLASLSDCTVSLWQ